MRYLPLEDLISNHLDDLFPGMEVLDHHAFRLTRNEDMVIEEDETENLIQALEAELLRRRFGPPIRLEITDDMDDVTLDLLVKELDITAQEVYRLPGPLDLRGLFDLSRIDRPDLRFTPHLPTTALAFQPGDNNERADIFAAIRKGDVLVHHPYESFATSVQSFLEQAAKDPHVLAIKQTLYRTSGDSPIVEALIDAAEAGKQVLALVEIKARFDEANNIVWARKLEKAGVHVVYGLVGLKTHCKLALVIREENGVLRSYSHVGTGNYNPKTSRIYEDFGLFTADDQVGRDLTRLFNELSGYAIEKKFKRILVAPLHLRKGLLRLIEKERRNALAGKTASVRIKVNSMVDEQIIDALYRASQAGVKVEVCVRGICSLKPGVEGMSENITVRSHPRPLPRALAHLRLPQRRRARGVHRQRRHDAPQPRPPGRGARAGVDARPRQGAERPLHALDERQHELVAPGAGRRMGAAQHRRGRQAAPGPSGQDDDQRAAPPAGTGGAMTETAVYAAGGVVWRIVDGKLRVLLIHRTKYRDVTLPKGKVDPGEMLAETAVREIHEETGIRVALGVPVGVSRYRLPSKRIKIVHYWAAEATEAAIRASAFVPNKEIAALEWVSPKKALRASQLPRRHRDPGDLRPAGRRGRAADVPDRRTAARQGALPRGVEGEGCRAPAVRARAQAGGLDRRPAPRLRRPQDRVEPRGPVRGDGQAARRPPSGARSRRRGLIGQDAWEEGKSDARTVVGDRVRARKPSVLCSHGPVLPDILSELALATGTLRGSYLGSASALEPAAFSVVHMSVDNPGSGIVAIETHIPKD